MNDWLIAAMLTLAASVHCVGMCGGFVLAVNGPGKLPPLALMVRQGLLHVGKTTSYVFLGALAGVVGAALMRSDALSWAGRGLSLAAGIVIGLAGLTLLGWRGTEGDGVAAWLAPAWNRVVGPLLLERPRGSALVVGMAMGFLPCPLIYAGLAAAAASGSPLMGASIMAGVGLGTLPVLAIVAAVGSLRPRRLGVIPVRVAGVLLLLTAALSLARGLGLRGHHGGHGPAMDPPAQEAPTHEH